MKPFWLLATRSEDAAADNEYEAFLTYCGLAESQLRRVRLEQSPMPQIDLTQLSGILVGGSPFSSSDPAAEKSTTQRRVEHELSDLLDQVVPQDIPFFGACYGIGSLGVHQGCVVDRTYPEPAGPVTITLNDDALADPLFSVLPQAFTAFVGHKEAITVPPSSATVLASSPTCPVQAFRVGHNIYATQFHPEMDAAGLEVRVDAYLDHGYFDPADADALKQVGRDAGVTEPMKLLRRFVELYARD